MGMLSGWRWCPRCRSGLEEGEGKVTCPECGLVIYANSEPTASALVRDGDGNLLLARRGAEPELGKWDLPGGFLEEGEHPLDAVKRELREEAGVEIEPLELVAIETDVYGNDDGAPWTLNLYWTARIVSGEPEPADDVSELRWFAVDELPPDDELAFDNVARVLGRLRRSPGPSS
ncbi:MAG: NUDIX domain-containing protein [Gaiellaceae bacterium]